MQKYVDTAQEKNRKVKRYEDLTFTDDFMFCKILQNNPELCNDDSLEGHIYILNVQTWLFAILIKQRVIS